MREERSIENFLVRSVQQAGGKAYKWGTQGTPDRICIFPSGRVVFVEVKSSVGRLSAIQKEQIALLQQLQQEVRVIKSYDEVRALCGNPDCV